MFTKLTAVKSPPTWAIARDDLRGEQPPRTRLLPGILHASRRSALDAARDHADKLAAGRTEPAAAIRTVHTRDHGIAIRIGDDRTGTVLYPLPFRKPRTLRDRIRR